MFKMMSCLLLALLTALSGAGYGERFLVSSDLHLTEDRALHASALGALGTAAGDFDGLILLGDTTNNAHDAEHAHALEFLEGLGTAAYVIPGNHDLTARLRPADFARLYGAYGWDGAFARDAETASCAVMTAGGTCLLLLDTNAYNGPDNVAALGGVSDGTLEWVAETLASIEEGTPVIASQYWGDTRNNHCYAEFNIVISRDSWKSAEQGGTYTTPVTYTSELVNDIVDPADGGTDRS